MNVNEKDVKILCQQYLIEAEGDPLLAYSLMELEYSLINRDTPIKNYDEFKEKIKGL